MYTQRFSFLLYSLLLLFVASPIVQAFTDTANWSLLSTFAFILILVTAIFAVSQTRGTLVFSVALASITAVVDLAHEISGGTNLKLTYYTTAMIFLTYTIVIVSRIIFSSSRVDANIIKGSICIYLLIGVLWAIIFSTIEAVQPGSFKRPIGAELVAAEAESEVTEAESEVTEAESMEFGSAETSSALYYSLVTLTTLGYGDITPLTPIARMFASLEALVGQLFVAILIARLVGIQVAQAKDP